MSPADTTRHRSKPHRIKTGSCASPQPVRRSDRPLAYDLFAGVGGASLGMRRAGLDVVGFERSSHECESQRRAGHRVVQIDVADVPWTSHRSPGVLWASPPCQPYSLGGKRRGSRDKRDGIAATLRAIEVLRPPLVILENVAGLASSRHDEERADLLGRLSELGYDAEHRVINCADYGVPQTRRRWFVVARRDDQPIQWPIPTNDEHGQHGRPPWRTMASGLNLTSVRQLRPRWPAAVAVARGGGGDVTWTFNRPAPTIVASFRPDVVARPAYRGPGSSPRQDAPGSVVITVVDALRLQGLPPDLPVAGPISAQFRQVGNAVPPVVAELLCRVNVSELSSGASGERRAA